MRVTYTVCASVYTFTQTVDIQEFAHILTMFNHIGLSPVKSTANRYIGILYFCLYMYFFLFLNITLQNQMFLQSDLIVDKL